MTDMPSAWLVQCNIHKSEIFIPCNAADQTCSIAA